MKRVSLLLLLIPFLFILPQDKIHKFVGELPYRHYTSKDGLAGSNVLSFLQDKRGFIWFVTTTGLSRFDGKNFVNYTTKDGLSSNNLTDIAQLKDSTIFISTYDKGLNYIKNGIIHEYEIKKERVPILYHLFEIDNKIISYADSYDLIFDNMIKHFFTDYNIKSNKKLINHYTSIYNIEKIDGKKIILISSLGILLVNDFNDPQAFTNILKGKYFSSYKNGDSVVIGGLGTLMLYNVNKRKSKNILFRLSKKKPIQNILIDEINNIWFSLLNEGLFLYKNNQVYDIGELLGIKKTQINFIKKDDENNIWIGTFGRGLYCLYNNNIVNYNRKDSLKSEFITCVNKNMNNNIEFGSSNGLCIFENNKITTLNLSNSDKPDFIRDIIKHGNKMIIIGALGPLALKNSYVITNLISRAYENIDYMYINCTSISFLNETKFIRGGWSSNLAMCSLGKNEYKIEKEFKIFNDSYQTLRVNKLLAESEDDYWIGTTLGLCHKKDSLTIYYPDNEILTSNINDIEKDADGRVWVAAENGVTYYEKGSWHVPQTLMKLNIVHSTSIAFDNKGGIWVGSTSGIYRLYKNHLAKYNSDNGLVSNDVNCVYYDKDSEELWVGTNQGISRLSSLILENEAHKLNAYINKISINNETKNYFDSRNLNFDSQQNNISISFSIPFYKYPSQIKYEYKFADKNDDWMETNSNVLNFASLSPGNYELLIRAKNFANQWSEPAIINFKIEPSFTQSKQFYLLVISVFILISVFGTRKYLLLKSAKINEKADIENKIMELKQQAATAMMNPHFIFNSLNSIQSFINNHNIEEANLYLSNFAKLIRLNLDVTRNSYINLKEEFNRLKLYLSLEKLRFGHGFNYFIRIDDKINPGEIFIPNMIIQPFVENAIWHGILPNENKGNVIIHCSFDNKDLIIRISDNGIGINNSRNSKNNTNISRGISIIKERLILLNGGKIEDLIKIIPLNNENNQGTLVIISLPPEIYHYDTL